VELFSVKRGKGFRFNGPQPYVLTNMLDCAVIKLRNILNTKFWHIQPVYTVRRNKLTLV